MWIVVVHFKRVIVVCSYMVQLQLQLFPVSSGGTSRYSQKKNVDFVKIKGIGKWKENGWAKICCSTYSCFLLISCWRWSMDLITVYPLWSRIGLTWLMNVGHSWVVQSLQINRERLNRGGGDQQQFFTTKMWLILQRARCMREIERQTIILIHV